ncbi:hypothetical protein BH23ACT4_BH23ACT4_14390 [soil metagenome]
MATTTELKDSTQEFERQQPILWMRVARAGAISMVVFAASLLAMAGGIIPPVAVIGVIYLGFIPFLKGPRRKLGLVFAALSTVVVAGNIPFIVSDLARPESSPTFILTLLSLVAVSLVIGGGLGVFFRWPDRPIRPFAFAAGAVFIIGSLASVAIAAGTESATALPTDTVVEARQVVWNPDEVSVQAGSGIWIDNRDPVHHSFTVTELGIDVEIPAMKAARIDLDAAPGVYQITCNVPGHEAMVGTLVISP